jgi:hypothetical protein
MLCQIKLLMRFDILQNIRESFIDLCCNTICQPTVLVIDTDPY